MSPCWFCIFLKQTCFLMVKEKTEQRKVKFLDLFLWTGVMSFSGTDNGMNDFLFLCVHNHTSKFKKTALNHSHKTTVQVKTPSLTMKVQMLVGSHVYQRESVISYSTSS